MGRTKISRPRGGESNPSRKNETTEPTALQVSRQHTSHHFREDLLENLDPYQALPFAQEHMGYRARGRGSREARGHRTRAGGIGQYGDDSRAQYGWHISSMRRSIRHGVAVRPSLIYYSCTIGSHHSELGFHYSSPHAMADSHHSEHIPLGQVFWCIQQTLGLCFRRDTNFHCLDSEQHANMHH